MKTNKPWSDVPDFELYDEEGYWEHDVETDGELEVRFW